MEFKGELAARAVVTAETLIAQTNEIRQRAMETHQCSAAIAAIREMGALSGMRIERKDVGAWVSSKRLPTMSCWGR